MTYRVLILLIATAGYLSVQAQSDYPLITSVVPPYDESVKTAATEHVKDYYENLREFSLASADREVELRSLFAENYWQNIAYNIAYDHISNTPVVAEVFLKKIGESEKGIDIANGIIENTYFVKWFVGLEHDPDRKNTEGFIFHIKGLRMDSTSVEEFVLVQGSRTFVRICRSLGDFEIPISELVDSNLDSVGLKFTYKGRLDLDPKPLDDRAEPRVESDTEPTPLAEALNFKSPFDGDFSIKRGQSKALNWFGNSEDQFKLALMRRRPGLVEPTIVDTIDVTGNTIQWEFSKSIKPGDHYFFRLYDKIREYDSVDPLVYVDSGTLRIKKRNNWLWGVGAAVVGGVITYLMVEQPWVEPPPPVFETIAKPEPPQPPGGG